MKLTIIIVNYNVRHFLEQCLHSVYKALGDLSAEIFVVDNHSVDGSCSMVREKFPGVKLIGNDRNAGFSKANNQAIRMAQGQYIVLLNPDTVVEEDTFRKVTDFMGNHPDAGGLGVKMIDGKGNYLPESKRGLPEPWVAFYKIFGLSKLFPGSKKFGKYHLSYLDKEEIHKVDVLSGAFMVLRKEVLDKVGLLDEAFFMYGEDIDLSYRITLGGYRNYYFPGTTIIHFKGESTKKGSINYVAMFYKAMIIFARKHFSSDRARWFSFLIHIAIWFRAFLSILSRIISRIFLPVTDALVIFAGYLFLTPVWEYLQFNVGYYPPVFLRLAVPLYIVFWILGIFSSGGYRKPGSLSRLIRGLFWGTIAILLAYSLINEEYRFSRALILLGSGWAMMALTAIRLILSKLKVRGFELDLKKRKRIAIIGRRTESERIEELLARSSPQPEVVGYISPDNSESGSRFIGNSGELEEIIRINRISELIFCAGTMSSADIIQSMLGLSGLDIDYKIAPPESMSIIGSNSIHTAGDLYIVNVNAISKPGNKRLKKITDAGFSLLLLAISPFICWFYRSRKQFFRNLAAILTGKLSFVGYIPEAGAHSDLPAIRPGILNPGDLFADSKLGEEKNLHLNILYAKDYKVITDLEIILKNWKKLERKAGLTV